MKLLSTLLLFTLAVSGQSLAQGVIKATVTMLPDGRQKNTVLNPETRAEEETITDKKGKLLSKTIYQLNERNAKEAATFYDGQGKMLYKAAYTLDAADRITEEIYSSVTGKPLGKRVYHFGANNRVARLDVYDAAGNLIPQKPVAKGRPVKKR